MQFEDDIKTNSKPKLFVDNEDYYIENKENHRLDVDDKCELKRGFLYIVDDQKVIKKYESMLENQENMANDEPINEENIKMHGKYQFVVLNKLTFALYENTDLNNLLEVINNINIEAIPFQSVLSNRHCFYMKLIRHTRQMEEYEKLQIQDGPFIKFMICSDTQKSMNRWIDLINSFKFCDDKVKEKYEEIKEKEQRVQDNQDDVQDDNVNLDSDFLEMQNMFRLKEQTKKMEKRRKLEEIQIMEQKLKKIREQKKCLEDSLK